MREAEVLGEKQKYCVRNEARHGGEFQSVHTWLGVAPVTSVYWSAEESSYHSKVQIDVKTFHISTTSQIISPQIQYE